MVLQDDGIRPRLLSTDGAASKSSGDGSLHRDPSGSPSGQTDTIPPCDPPFRSFRKGPMNPVKGGRSEGRRLPPLPLPRANPHVREGCIRPERTKARQACVRPQHRRTAERNEKNRRIRPSGPCASGSKPLPRQVRRRGTSREGKSDRRTGRREEDVSHGREAARRGRRQPTGLPARHGGAKQGNRRPDEVVRLPFGPPPEFSLGPVAERTPRRSHGRASASLPSPSPTAADGLRQLHARGGAR
eukprot:scaffold649_cov347-Pavlova_lutheri.AAC.143